MSDTINAPQLEVQSFLTTGIDLKRLLRDVAKHSRPAVEALVSLISNTDPKIKLAAAKALLELNISVATAINEDALKRLIAETRLGSGMKRLTDSEDSNTPLVNFNEIREI